MMIDDDRKEGKEGADSFKTIADAKEEQDYAINQYKGSGNMSDMLDSMESDAKLNNIQALL